MTRRLTVTIVGVVAGALVFAVLGTTLLLRFSSRAETRRQLTRQAERIATGVETVQAPRVLNLVGRALRLEGQAVVRVGPAGRINGALPDGVGADDLDVAALRAGRTLTGNHGSLVYAAAPAVRDNALLVVVLTQRVGAGNRRAWPWFALASLVALVVAAAVAVNLGRRLTRPLRDAEAATTRIAAGDLAARVPEHPGDSDELAQLSRSINSMAATLERSRGLERQFLLSVSHDLRTPLTSIRGYAEAIAEGTAPDPAAAAGVITSESRRLERLVRDLLELARLDARRFSLDVRSTDVAEVVTETADGFRPAADEAGVVLTVDAPDGAGSASADPDRLAQVVANLIENAMKFAATRIDVAVSSADGAGVAVAVTDDGPGIPADDLPHVFERFYSSHRTAAREVGSGLGLAIVAELVTAMGGTVRAENTGAGGARVVVTLRPWASQT